ncbi:hypothetical protein Ddye_030315 [Dipteronia dyeriana]|uniref:Glycosyltransferase n=1 Tax=Dipteronia dyeriana TaxID=168575 RepID=A0AAD9WMM1_9ROSI|nr:hypothetical protein Ddye_030315 [Dipteronia dyeriana]
MAGEVLVLPAFGHGHLFPSMELCKLMASRDYKTTLVVFSFLSPSIPSSFLEHPLIQVTEIPSPFTSEPVPMHPDSKKLMHTCLENLLSTRDPTPICAIADVLIIMTWTEEIFKKFNVPTIGFFTSGACSAAMEYATWKNAHPQGIKPGEIRLLPGLPEEMGMTESDLKRRSLGHPHGPAGGGPRGPGGPQGPKRRMLPGPGDEPPWVDDTEGSVALMINTCDDIERPFIEYLTKEIGKPVWGVGPLFSEQYWESSGSLVRDSKIRSNRQGNVTEEKVIEWLDSKPRGSVLYVSFGSSVDLSIEEYPELASALEESARSFIWVIPANAGRSGPGGGGSKTEGYYPEGLDSKVGESGLIIRGWAPQLLILSHPSTGGFLSHCGWNSTVEAIGRGVPFLTLPLRGDQYYDADLVVKHLKIGYRVLDDLSNMVKKDDIVKGIERLLDDKEMKKRAEQLGAKFGNGFPQSSMAALDDFVHFFVPKSP